MDQYIDEGLIALLPIYTATDRAIVVTQKNEYFEGRTVPWLVEKLATYYSMNINELRRLYGDLLNVKKHVIVPINDDLVLLPVKTRAAVVPGETTIGYCSLLQVDNVGDYAGPPGPWLASIQFKTGYELFTLNTTETLRDKIRQGEQVRHHYIKRRGQGPGFAGLSRADLVDCMPNCDCLLLDVFRFIVRLKDDDV